MTLQHTTHHAASTQPDQQGNGHNPREQTRLERLNDLQLLDTGATPAFDRLTRLAARILNVPTSIVTLIDDHRQYLKSFVGIDDPWATRREMPLRYSYCKFIVASDQPLVVSDARLNELVKDSPSISELNALAYAGMPLTTSDGHTLGALCVVDTQPRQWTDEELEILSELRQAAMTEIELQGEILQRRRVEAELRENKRFVESVIKTLPDSLYVYDLDKKDNLYSNDLMPGLLGYSPEEFALLGPEPLNVLLHPDDLEMMQAHERAHRTQADGDITTVEYRVLHKDGTYRWFSSRDAVFHRSNSGSVDQIIGIARDITAQKSAEAALRESQQLIEGVLQTIPDTVYIYDVEAHKIGFTNRNIADLLGYSYDDLIAMGELAGTRLVHPDDLNTFMRHLVAHNALNDREIAELEYRALHRDGTTRWLNRRTRVFQRDAKGKVTQTIVIVQEITRRKAIEAELQESQQFVQGVVETMPDIVYVYDVEARKNVFINREVWSLLGYTYEELLAMGTEAIAKIVHPDDMEVFVRQLAQQTHLRDDELMELEYRALHRDGTYRWLYRRARPFKRDEHGNTTQIIGIAQDITRRKQAETALRDNQQFTESIVNTIPDVVYVFDLLAQKNVYANRETVGMLGYTPDEVQALGANYLPSHIHADDQHMIYERFAALPNLPAGEISSVEYRIRHRDGHYLWLDSRDSGFLRDENGQVTQILGIARDVTARKEAERQLNESIVRLNTLRRIEVELGETLSLEMVLAVSMDAALRISGADDGFIGLVDELADEIKLIYGVGGYKAGTRRPLGEGVTGRVYRHRQAELVRDVLSDPDYQHAIPHTRALILVPLVHRDRQIGILRLETRKPERFTDQVFDFIRLIIGRITISIDNAQLYETSQAQLGEMRQLYARVRDLEEMKTDMIRIAAHDLRNPLGIVLGYGELLAELPGDMSADQSEWVAAMHRAGKKMQKIINDILSLERIEASMDRANTEVFDLAALVQAAAEDHRPAAEGKQQQFELALPPAPLLVRGHNAHLREAVENLIGNAIKYTPDGGLVRVQLGRAARPEQVHFEVKDTGYGIPADQQEKLFKPFYRANTAETKRIEGTGLGLHLVKNVIERHGGKMHFTSEYGQGSTFSFDLPLHDPEREIGTGELPNGSGKLAGEATG